MTSDNQQFHPGAMAAGDQIIQAMRDTAQGIIDGDLPSDPATHALMVKALEPLMGDVVAELAACTAINAMGYMWVAAVQHVNGLLEARTAN